MAAIGAQFSAIPTKTRLSKCPRRAVIGGKFGHPFSSRATGGQILKSFHGWRSGSEVSVDLQSIFSSGSFSRGPILGGRGPNLEEKRGVTVVVYAGMGGRKLEGRKLRVAVVGGGPAGGSAAETLAKGGVETFLIERKLDNAKPCGGAIPLCMVGEFDLPLDIIDRRVTKMKMISPSNVAVDVGRTLKENEYIGMVRREVLDNYLRERAAKNGATVINGLFLKMDIPKDSESPYVLHYNSYDGKSSQGTPGILEVDAVVGADGANSKVAKSIDAGDYDYAIAFQERIRIPEEKMAYYENLAEMYVGDDVSPDFYGWVFPKCDHVAVGTGTVIDKPAIKKYQLATRNRAKEKIEGGKIIRVEAHPIPEHPRPRRANGRVALVGDAAGYVTKCSGEGIYFAAKSGRMCAEAIVEGSANGTKMIDESDLRKYLQRWDKKYWPTYKVLDILQKVFYRSNPAREAFVEMCADEYVQKMTFDSYLYKTVVPGNPIDDLKLAINTIGSLIRANALTKEMKKLSV
uniref:Geranylgeranyl diphosphate reductase, chloroplastic n=1 Tax=Araucaria cunninghamii TaxID=56994 RepID=A0A0D6R0H4_ARACU